MPGTHIAKLPWTSGGGLTVSDPLVALLVGDDPGDAELIAGRLGPSTERTEAAAVRLLHADSAATACLMLRQMAIDVVILDLSLPDTRWLKALYQFRATAPAVPVIVLGGDADEAIALEALRAGAQDYVLKPLPDGATLHRILRYARERQHLLKELDVAVHASATAARRWRILAEVGKVLARSRELGTAIAEIALLVVPDAADCFILYLVGDDETPAAAEVAHVDGRRALELRRRLQNIRPADVIRACEQEASLRAFLAAHEVPSELAVPLRPDGQARGFAVLAAMARRRDGGVGGEFVRSLADRIGLAVDQARLLRQTQRAVAVRDRAVGIVSHDLRNPLSTIQICATALLDPVPPPADGIRRMAQIIHRSAAWMQQIVQDLLDRASLDAGRLMLDRKPTAVADVIGAAQVMFAPLAEDRSLEFAVEGAPDLPRVDADPHRLLQVLSNLLSNAMKFTPAGGRVMLSAQVADERNGDAHAGNGARGAVRFTVTDTGRGIPPEDLPHVFDWFWHSQPGKRNGTGLGLAIAKGLIEAHRGRLHVESVPGRGSTFWFTIPTADSERDGSA